ncbi:type II toxin-antitoxin system TacA family antitoxin [Aliterella atlantica]|uniref:DUF1778 domain-containing protein n=1 Tax=Aliterella atlantica CENA595 TaxID=1618023 RepID=A0A0D8ZRN9_9CYAN|nr:DUF1778 domain-containing protein [Aliterella atlantica]KJH69861.1 hypothetical protein UH38_21220 [Aliterella atlantica CENA595]
MVDSVKKETRITARVTPRVQATLQEAAELSGATINQFIVQAALKEAHRVLEAERIITLSARDAETVFNLIENPPAPNELLKAAALKHKQYFSESNSTTR